MITRQVSPFIIGPIAEGVFIHSIFYGGVRTRLGFVPALLMTSIIFGLLYGINIDAYGVNFYGAYGLFIGIVLTLLYEYTKNIFVPIAVHIVYDLSGFVLIYLGIRRVIYGFSNFAVDFIALILVILAMVAILIYLIRKAKAHSKEPWCEGKWKAEPPNKCGRNISGSIGGGIRKRKKHIVRVICIIPDEYVRVFNS